jgi:hypothetical protein
VDSIAGPTCSQIRDWNGASLSEEADEAIALEEEGRLNLYKDLLYAYDEEGQAIMHVSSVVNEIVKTAGSLPEQQ